MKVLFVSDIHDNINNLNKIKDIFDTVDRIICLGDLGHTRKIIDFLGYYKDKLILVRGNCDDIDLLNDIGCSVVDDIFHFIVDNLDIYITHGHIYNINNFNYKDSILVYGHKHVPFIIPHNSNYFINTGSIGSPRNGSMPSYIVYENKEFIIYNIEREIVLKKVF